MAFDSMADFLAMGTHGFYVWLTYGTTFVVLGALVAGLRYRSRSVWRELSEEDQDQ